MAMLADAIEEFKQASPGGKALMMVALVAVAGLGIYVYKSRSSSSGGSLVPIGGGGGDSGGASGGTGGTGGTTTTTTSNPPEQGNPPKNPAPPTTTKPKGVYVTVTKFPSQLSTLWGIAEKYYGNGALWQRIAQANNISDPRQLRVGQRLFVPT